MRIIILGGGIAGQACSLVLRRNGLPVTIYERAEAALTGGYGFLLMPNGVAALQRLGCLQAMQQVGYRVENLQLKAPRGDIIDTLPLENSYILARSHLVGLLREAAGEVVTGMAFSHFEYDEQGNARAACFANGDRVEGDVFIGADGIGSAVRRQLFPEHKPNPVRIKELVFQVHHVGLAKELGPHLIKFQTDEGGLGFGIAPTSTGTIFCYLQFDVTRRSPDSDDPAGREAFCREAVGHWADPIPRLLDLINFRHCYLARVTDMDMMPLWSRGNVTLTGDAAHPFVALTSQGVNAALEDALVLGTCLINHRDGTNWDKDFTAFRKNREDAVRGYLEEGRKLTDNFLHPERFKGPLKIPAVK